MAEKKTKQHVDRNSSQLLDNWLHCDEHEIENYRGNVDNSLKILYATRNDFSVVIENFLVLFTQ